MTGAQKDGAQKPLAGLKVDGTAFAGSDTVRVVQK